MKIKNRNKNFKLRLIRTSCVLTASILGIGGITAGVLSSIAHQDAFAANQTVNRTGLDSIGENEIQMLSNRIKLTDDASIISIATTGQIKKMKSKCYTEAEMQNGTYDSERSSQVSYWTATKHYCDSVNIVYDFGNSLAAGTHDVDGSFTLIWRNAAHDADGHAYNVKMHVDNIKVANARNVTRPVSIMVGGEHAVYAAVQEKAASELSGENYELNGFNMGASYDVEISVLEPSTNAEITGKKTVYQMVDLDQPDYYTNNASPSIYSDNEGNPAPFAEGITLISGIEPNVYVGANSLLKITDTHYGSNTRFTATTVTNEGEQERSSIAFRGDASGFKYRWYGSNCITTFGWIGSKKVTTSTSGPYKDNGRITPTDNEVLWKEDKSISAVPDPGYYVSKITVDGREVSFTPDSTGRVTYTFDDVIADHTIDAQFAPYDYKVTVRHYKEGTTTPVADPVVSDNHHAGDTYTSHEETVDGYHVVTRPDPETVTFTDRDIEMIYYYAEDTYKVTVRHYKEGTTAPVADPVVSDNHHTGDTYTSQPADVDGYRLVERPDPETVTFTDRDIEMIYYYAPIGNITVEYCDVDTKKCDLTEIVTDEGIDGDESRVCVEKKFDGYNFVNKEGGDCILSKDTTKIKYWYKKQPKNPVTADINVGGYAAAALGLTATVTGALFFITKRR